MRWPLMANNISRRDRLDASNFFLEGGSSDLSDMRLTQGPQVAAFEREFAQWLGVKYAVMVNSGASANLLTMHAISYGHKGESIIVPTITWSSDIMSVLHAGMRPVFVDVNPRTLGMDANRVVEAIGAHTRAVFMTHTLGFNALTAALRDELEARGIALVEDCCESIGATFNGGKLGTFGLASNFSFYYGHHMTTIEGGIICTDDEDLAETCRLLRSHGMTREAQSADKRAAYEHESPLTYPEFTFERLAFNVRSTEINAVIGRAQLKRLGPNVERRIDNLRLFLSSLNRDKFRTDYRVEGSSNFALPLVLREPDAALMGRVTACLAENGVEYRRGTAGGGNQLRQPYLRRWLTTSEHWHFPQTEHIHQFGLYLGNYPALDLGMVGEMCDKLNAL